MKKVVWKFSVPVDDQDHDVEVPRYGRIHHVGCQTVDAVCFWMLVDADESEETYRRRFRVFGTGQPIGEDWWYVGTAMPDPSLVWHLFEHDKAPF